MPTRAQLIELRECCTWLWITKNGVHGYLGKGPNGNTLFLPATGYFDGTTHISADSFGYYWSHSVLPAFSINALSLDFFSGGIPGNNDHERAFGLTVRPVRVL